MYLANDVIQNSKKKGSEFTKEFHGILKPSFQHIAKYVLRTSLLRRSNMLSNYRDIDPSTLASLDRIIKVWDERSVFDKASIKSFSQALHSNDSSIVIAKENGSGSSNNATNATAAALNKNPSSKPLVRKRELEDAKVTNARKKTANDAVDPSWMTPISSQYSDAESLPVDLSKYEPVEPDKLIKSLKELENCASADATTRQKISNFPPELFNVNLMEKAVTAESAVHWYGMVEEAQSLLVSYNTRLRQEMEDRKQLSVMLSYFIEGQKRALAETEKSQQEYRDKLKQVLAIREELKSHLQNLPDLSALTAVTPLPSALDLFNPQQ